MTLFTAAILALTSGVAVAWYTYFYKWRSTPYWALAFLRFGWIGMLFFALFAPEREEQVVIEQPQLISLRIDSSSSLKSPVNGILEVLLDFEKKAPVKWVISDFNSPQEGNDELPWVYVGDGHIDNQEGPGPVASVLLIANDLLSPPLIKNAIVPERVEVGTQFKYSVRCSSQPASIKATFNGETRRAETATFTAPDRPGTFTLQIAAEKDGVVDAIEETVEVVPYFNSIQII